MLASEVIIAIIIGYHTSSVAAANIEGGEAQEGGGSAELDAPLCGCRFTTTHPGPHPKTNNPCALSLRLHFVVVCVVVVALSGCG